DGENWFVARGERAVLVGCGLNGDCTIGQLDQPGPAAAEDAHGGGGQLVLKGGEGSEFGVYGFGQLACGSGTALAQGWPPEGVVGVTTAVVADGCADGIWDAGEIRDQLLDGLACQLRMGSRGCVEVVNV